MFDAQHFVAGQGIWIVLGLIFAGGLGLPLPAPPVLIAAGVLAGTGQLSLLAVLAGSLLAIVAADLLWFQLGRWRGRRILALLCRISIEPDSCVRKTENLFARNQTTALLVAKFLPGLKTVAPPLAGMMEMPVLRFALYDGLGALLWIAAFTALGYLFSEQAASLAPLGGWLAAAVLALFAGWLLWKWIERRIFVRGLGIARVTPEELHEQLKAGEVVVVDLRSSFEIESGGAKVRGALQMTPRELEARHGEIPRDREVVLYCGCPGEESAAAMAKMLRERGVSRARPLLGGIEAWRARGYPVETVAR